MQRAIVYIDCQATELAPRLAAAAADRDIAMVLVCSRGSRPDECDGLAEVIELPDLGLERLRECLAELDGRYDIRGLYCAFGPFRPEGFIAGAVATLREERGLAGSPAAALARATNKLLAREALARAGVPDIQFGYAHDRDSLLRAAERVGYPLILKPLTGVGSSLILRCANQAEAIERFEFALRTIPTAHFAQLRMAAHEFEDEWGRRRFEPASSMLVESYIGGREASVEVAVVGARAIPLVVHDKISVEELGVTVHEHILVTPPERFSAAEVAELEAHAVACVEALGLRDVLCHVELRYSDGVGPRLLEVNPRIGAGCVQDSLTTFLGLDMASFELDLILGQAEIPSCERVTDSRHAMLFLFSPRSGRLNRLGGLRRLLYQPGVKVVRAMAQVGETVGGDHEEGFIAGIWMEAANSEVARQAYDHIRTIVDIEVE